MLKHSCGMAVSTRAKSKGRLETTPFYLRKGNDQAPIRNLSCAPRFWHNHRYEYVIGLSCDTMQASKFIFESHYLCVRHTLDEVYP